MATTKRLADAANITVSDDFGSFSAETDLNNRYERFDDIGGHEEEIQRVPLPELQDVQHQQPPSSRVSPLTSHHEPPKFGLDGLGEPCIYTVEDDDQSHHQADASRITVSNDFGSCSAETDLNNRYERFDDIGGHEEEIQRVPSPELQDVQHQQPPSSCVSSPPTSHHEPPTEHEPMVEEQEEQQPEDQTNEAQEPDGA